ncbi:MAG: class I tRNA ligase family protein, partial [bacterium]
ETDGEDPALSWLATDGEGKMINSGSLNGLSTSEAITKVIQELASKGLGKATSNFRLRDWLISRQRYWGTPIPIIHCPKCGEVPVPLEQLPVKLPDSKTVDLKPKGSSPLATATEWLNVDCPKCGVKAQRDTDTMDTFVDSSWYFLRYTSVNHDDKAFDLEEVKTWLPVDQY